MISIFSDPLNAYGNQTGTSNGMYSMNYDNQMITAQLGGVEIGLPLFPTERESNRFF